MLLLRPHRLQAAQLPRLASLCLDSCQYSPASLGVLSCLSGSLTHLDIESGYLPGSMSALTQLRDLRLWDCDPHGTDAVLSTALPHLRHLSRLVSNYRAAALGEATQLCRTSDGKALRCAACSCTSRKCWEVLAA